MAGRFLSSMCMYVKPGSNVPSVYAVANGKEKSL